MAIHLDPLERKVMDLFLAGDHPVLAILREQFWLAEVIDREFTGVGFFTRFSVPATAPRVQDFRLQPASNVHADIEGVEYGAAFVLFFNDGAIDFLEGVTYDGPWPASVEKFDVSYINGVSTPWLCR